MSEFKFACPVCGQHITCDSAKSGTQLDCPTCYKKLIVPHAPQGDVSKLILNASLARSRPLPQTDATARGAGRARPCANKFPIVAVVVVVCVAAAFFLLRDLMFNKSTQPATAKMTNDLAWKLDLNDVTIPDTPAAGRISGRVFTSQHASLRGGVLTLRQESPDLGMRITMFVREAVELAGKHINVETNHARAPNVVFGWRDDPQQPLLLDTPPDYALRLQFGAVADGRIPGKIYFCATDNARSWVAGTFDAEIVKSSRRNSSTR